MVGTAVIRDFIAVRGNGMLLNRHEKECRSRKDSSVHVEHRRRGPQASENIGESKKAQPGSARIVRVHRKL